MQKAKQQELAESTKVFYQKFFLEKFLAKAGPFFPTVTAIDPVICDCIEEAAITAGLRHADLRKEWEGYPGPNHPDQKTQTVYTAPTDNFQNSVATVEEDIDALEARIPNATIWEITKRIVAILRRIYREKYVYPAPPNPWPPNPWPVNPWPVNPWPVNPFVPKWTGETVPVSTGTQAGNLASTDATGEPYAGGDN